MPVLEYKVDKNMVQYRYTNCIKDFKMPIKMGNNDNRWIKPATTWQTINLPAAVAAKFSIDPNFYIITKKVD